MKWWMCSDKKAVRISHSSWGTTGCRHSTTVKTLGLLCDYDTTKPIGLDRCSIVIQFFRTRFLQIWKTHSLLKDELIKPRGQRSNGQGVVTSQNTDLENALSQLTPWGSFFKLVTVTRIQGRTETSLSGGGRQTWAGGSFPQKHKHRNGFSFS